MTPADQVVSLCMEVTALDVRGKKIPPQIRTEVKRAMARLTAAAIQKQEEYLNLERIITQAEHVLGELYTETP